MHQQKNIIARNPEIDEFRRIFDNHKSELTKTEIYRRFISTYFEEKDQLTAKRAWHVVTGKWLEEDLAIEQSVIVSDLGEEDFDKYVREMKHRVLKLIGIAVAKMENNKDWSPDAKELRNVKDIFDALHKAEMMREDLLLKRQKARADVALKVYDLFGRYGRPDPKLLAQMREALGNHDRRLNIGTTGEQDGSTDAQGVGVDVEGGEGVPYTEDGVTAEG